MNKWNFFTVKEIRPCGWLKRQLEIQAEGLSGNLDKMWRDVRDSAWIGGDADGWERVPYWLDGFIPLAYLLESEDMIARANKYVDAILNFQREDGWICPCADEERATYDAWALFLLSKVLVLYYDCSGDERAITAVYRALKNYHGMLVSGEAKLGYDPHYWSLWRWFECFIALNFLRERFDEPWIGELAQMLYEQGRHYPDYTHKWVNQVIDTVGETHIVNIGMQLKTEAVTHALLGLGYTDEAERLYQILREYNGTAVDTFTGDEHLAGLSPIHGTELCAVVEQMYSYEWLYAVTGEAKWAERLETVAFNALPATISDDMWTHQYVQLSNQIACVRFNRNPIFGTNGRDAHIFGLEPNFGCCTANFNQGWPKLALSAFMHRNDTVVNVLPIPSELNCAQGRIRLDTEYPFKNRFVYTVEAAKDFTLQIRIPSFAENLRVNGEAAEGPMLSVLLKAGEHREIAVSYEAMPHFEARPHGLQTVKYGSLVFSLPIRHKAIPVEYTRRGVERRFPYCDYLLQPQSDWNYAYSGRELTVTEREIGPVPFSADQPPIVIGAKMKKIDWGFEEGFDSVCAKVPRSREPIGPEEAITLIPYGAAKLRMTELPLIEE